MSDYLTNFFKSEDSAGYAKRANSGMMLGYPVSIGGESRNPENGIGYHSTIKVFNRDNDHGHLVHHMASNLPLNPPDPKTTHIEPSEFKARDGSTVYVIKLHGRSSDKIKEHHGKFAGMGDPENYEFQPHISVSKELHDKIKTSGAKTAHEAKIEFGNAELKRGPQTIKTYHHKPDSAEPAVPDEGDMTAKIPYEPQMGKLAASEKDLLCPIHKAENNNLKPLMKPYVSDAQRRWAHTPTGTKALGGEAGVHEWDEATKGKKLPERVAKSEMIPSPSKDTHKELTLHHGTKSPSDFEHFDMKHHASGFYPGIYTSSNPEDVKKHGRPIKVGFKGHLFEIKDPKHADQLHRHVGGGGSGHPLVQKLKAAGYHGIKRGSEHIIFDPEHAKIQKSELALSKSEIPLEKGALKTAGAALGMAAALAGSHPAAAETRAPANIQQTKSHLAKPRPENYDHQRMLRAIAQVESSGGINTHHGEGGGPIHGHERAYGAWGTMPETIRETIAGHKDLRAQHEKALALKGNRLHHYMKDHPGLDKIIADRHLTHMEHVLGQDPALLGYGWLNGTTGALEAKRKGSEFRNHWHAKRVKDAYDKEE